MNLKVLIVLATPFLLLSCNQTEKIQDDPMTEYLEPAHQHEDVVGLSLNNGKKWQIDVSTRTHVNILDSTLVVFKSNGKKEPEDYQLLAKALRKELNGLIADCKMKGPEHDALHSWLLPVIEDVGSLEKVTSAKEGRESLEKFDSKLRDFYKYFS